MTVIDHEFSDLPTPSGAMRTFIFRPATEQERYPGVVLFSEIFHATGPSFGRAAPPACAHPVAGGSHSREP